MMPVTGVGVGEDAEADGVVAADLLQNKQEKTSRSYITNCTGCSSMQDRNTAVLLVGS